MEIAARSEKTCHDWFRHIRDGTARKTATIRTEARKRDSTA